MAQAAVAALRLASSIVSLVGLAGQILQDCHYVSNLFGDVNGAPDAPCYLGAKFKTSALCLTIFKGCLRACDSLPALMLLQNKYLWHSATAAPQSKI